MRDLAPTYDPTGIEAKWYDHWTRLRLFTADPASTKPAYAIVIPLPNVTGRLTLGHVLNTTIQDALIRFKKLNGYETLWLPGMDHAGIATEVRVEEERLLSRGLTKRDLGRGQFVAEVWKWKEEYAQAIRDQLRSLGCALDWTREKFTLSDDYSQNVTRVFIELYRKNLIYRGERIVNWCPRCLTALSDEQVEVEEKPDQLYYIKYPVAGQADHVTVATTRPETMLGDTALCVNPDDPRYRHLIGKQVVVPLIERLVPVIADAFADPEFGTGALKVTPAHDPFDFDLARKHGLALITVMNEDGTMNQNAGAFAGMDRFAARRAVVDQLRTQGLLEKIDRYRVPLAMCERCHTVVEPRLSKQWFVRMKPLAEPAIQAVRDGRIKIYPRRWVNLYDHWLENVRDWCISRQIWWGHRIPIYYCGDCHADVNTDQTRGVMVSATKPDRCPDCQGTNIVQDQDVLDTWFSSWLWPFATLGWPDATPDMKKFYPTSTLVTAWDIIYLWVARMVMAGLEFTGSVPFHEVLFHTMIRDEKGRKMSKSLGNSPEPMDLIARYGVDALRFGLLLITPREQDVLFSEKSIDVGRKFCNKLWNAARFLSLNAKTPTPDAAPAATYDSWIREEFNTLLDDINTRFVTCEINAIARRLYDFVWHTFCDWYLEFLKPPTELGYDHAVAILRRILILLHPFAPFITEEIYQRLPGHRDSILQEEWPRPLPVQHDTVPLRRTIALIQAIRGIRGMFNIPAKRTVPIALTVDDEATDRAIRDAEPLLVRLAGVSAVTRGEAADGPAATIELPSIHCRVMLEGIDAAKEKTRLEKEIAFLTKTIDEIARRLSNPQFQRGASEETRHREQERLESYRAKRTAVTRAIERL